VKQCHNSVTVVLDCCSLQAQGYDPFNRYTDATLWLHCCFTVVTLLSHCCYTVPDCSSLQAPGYHQYRVLHCCHTVVTLLLHYCYTVVTLWLHCGYTVVTLLLHYCYTVVTLLLHCCYAIVPDYCSLQAPGYHPCHPSPASFYPLHSELGEQDQQDQQD
jgi:hypothetical protein